MRAGRLEVVWGSMFSGKTEELFRRLRRAEIAKQTALLFRPASDTRTGEAQSHWGRGMRAESLARAGDALAYLVHEDPVLVAFDEAQFFEEDGIVGCCRQLVHAGKRVIVCGLDLDWRGEPFLGMARLAAEAQDVLKLHAVCARCGGEASRTWKLAGEGDRVEVGGADKYEARCLSCFSLGGEE